MAGSIHILNASSLRAAELDGVARAVKDVFHLPVSSGGNTLDLPLAYDGSRRQFNSTALLAQILSQANHASDKRIAIVDVDLYIPILTFVFGEAQLDGPAAIVSTHRLANEFYGLPQDAALSLQRLAKEVIHELGHTFGLYHCRQFDCVMRPSTYVEEIDLKRSAMCASCAGLLAQDVQKFIAI